MKIQENPLAVPNFKPSLEFLDLTTNPVKLPKIVDTLDFELTSSAGRSARWDKLYGPGLKMKELFINAYNDALMPALLAACDVCGRDNVRVLVVGAGDGFFSRHVQPHIEQELQSYRPQARLQVVETDPVAEALSRSPAQRKVVCGFEDLLVTFLGEHFDIVIGESMLHQAMDPQELNDAIKNLSALGFLMDERSTFVHVQDNVPDPRHYLSPEELLQSGLHMTAGLLATGSLAATQAMAQVTALIQTRQLEFIRTVARASHFNTLGAYFEGSAACPHNTLAPELQTYLKQGRVNTLNLKLGTVGYSFDPEFKQAGAVCLQWGGMVTMLTQTLSTKEIIRAIDIHEDRLHSKTGP